MAKKIILGTAQFGLSYGINNKTGKPDLTTTHEILDFAYRNGVYNLDTAEGYGNAENIIGSYCKNYGREFAINTKFKKVTKGNLRTECLNSLQRLSVKQIRTYFFHRFDDFIECPELILELIQLKREKLIGMIGVSVYTNTELETVIKHPNIDVVQIPFNLLDNHSQRGNLLKMAKEYNKIVQVRSVFLQGLFFKNLEQIPFVLLPLKPHLEKIHTIAREMNQTMESLCLKYVFAQPDIDEIIIGVDNKEQFANNLTWINSEIDPDLIQTLDSINVKEQELLYPYNWK